MMASTRVMTRRQALLAACGVGGLALTRAHGAEATSERTGKKEVRIGCGTVTFRKLSLDDALQRIARAGYEYCETQATGPWCPHVDAWKDDPEKFKRRVQDYGFKGVTGLWSPHGAIIANPKSVEGITQAIRWAAAAGIPVVHAGDGKKPEGMSDDDALKLMRGRLAEILEVAEKCRVYLGIEPHGSFSLTTEGLRRIMGLSSSPWLGINYDTANVHRVTYAEKAEGAYAFQPYGERQDEVATLAAVADRVVHLHLKDVVGAKCVALGEGGVNLAGCLDVLRQRHYAGAFSLETEGDMDPQLGQQMIERSRAWLVKALA
ncbi:MAG TPA: sugar phosphate isomerase/epimerase family protein [Verrucomicrobiae bacterium]|nr:sugar phosphate isomerase/epimerase family protein [Verrucomicrobiae bacterium]